MRPLLKRTAALFITTALAAAFTLSASAVGLGKVNTNSLRLRSGPNTSASILANYDTGKQVIIFDVEDEWYKVYVDGSEGYMSAEYVDTVSDADFDAIPAVISTALLNFRHSPSVDSAVIKQLAQGAAITVIGVENGWFKAKHGDDEGYVHPSYIKLGSASGDEATGAGQTESGATTAQKVVELAMSLRGVPYVYGGKSPKGFDCSGLTYYVYKQFGINISGGASTQLQYGTKVSRSELLPGDLVFFRHPNASGNYPASHVGIYIGNGEFIHAPQPGYVVKVQDIYSGYYATGFVGGRRLLN